MWSLSWARASLGGRGRNEGDTRCGELLYLGVFLNRYFLYFLLISVPLDTLPTSCCIILGFILVVPMR